MTVTPEQAVEAVRVHGSINAAARALGIARSTLRGRLAGKEPTRPSPTPADRDSMPSGPRLTRQLLHQALQPPNNCHVKRFADTLDVASRKVLEEALAYDKRDLPAPRLREILVGAGFVEADVPGVDAINAHRSGVRPCRCKG